MFGKDRKLIFGIVVLLEIIIFLVTAFVINKITLQSIFGVFSVFGLISVLFFFISFKKSEISIKKNNDPINKIGLNKITLYYGDTKEVNIDDLIVIQKSENLKNIFLSFLLLLVSLILSVIAFYV